MTYHSMHNNTHVPGVDNILYDLHIGMQNRINFIIETNLTHQPVQTGHQKWLRQ
jgi:hypothetical protein